MKVVKGGTTELLIEQKSRIKTSRESQVHKERPI